jgi:hypothetical protein
MIDLGLHKKYDLIYGHWSIGYLVELDLAEFLKKCRASLLRKDDQPSGIMIVKETISSDNHGINVPIDG